MFYKIFNGLTPSYLADQIPERSETNIDLRRRHSTIAPAHSRTLHCHFLFQHTEFVFIVFCRVDHDLSRKYSFYGILVRFCLFSDQDSKKVKMSILNSAPSSYALYQFSSHLVKVIASYYHCSNDTL